MSPFLHIKRQGRRQGQGESAGVDEDEDGVEKKERQGVQAP